jgi:bifunctional UDP-N-acetylglucosamine pyrophosphorylase/glucosamine-1-phosphate N-acetyltransferase
MSFAFKESKNTSYSFVGNNDESLGINNLIDLSNAQKINRKRVLDRLMLAGVIIEDPDSTYIDDTVTVGVDTVIKPGTLLRGDTRIGNNCEIGPGSQIIDSLVAENCRVWNSIIEGSILETNVLVGPYSHIRPESYLSNNVKVGNFSEIKASRLEEGVRMSHFGYIGDASIGARVNLGAGMVTCNYDGTDKNHTTIGEGSFIGSGTMLVAPIVIGPGSVTGAGSVVITDVQNGDRVAGVPAKSIGPKN